MKLEALQEARRVIGAKQVIKLVKRQGTELVFVAEDAEAAVTDPIRELCRTQGVELVSVETMQELGQACGIEVKAAAAAVLK
jgi:large subunit ribosomal protein L7A